MSIPWLPNTTDTRAVLAALDNEFFRSASVQVIPSEGSLDRRYEPYPWAVTAIGTLEIANVTAEQATAIHTVIHSEKRAFAWGRPGSPNYQWPKFFSFRIYLVTRDGDSAPRIMFPILFGSRDDIDPIVKQSKDSMHHTAYKDLGITPDQMTLKTYTYDEKSGWSQYS